jgi:hypothetical protein
MSCAQRDGTEFHGVKLGMTADAVRAHYDAPASFQTDGTVLKAVATAGDVATFEFHRGVLVAVRGTTLQAPMGLPSGIRYSAGGVVEVTKADAAYSFRWIARDCPAHAEEAETLLRTKSAASW